MTLSPRPAPAARHPRRRGAAGRLAGVTPGDERVRELYAVLQVMLRIKFNLLMAGRERLQFVAKASTGIVSLEDRLAHLRRLRRHLKALREADAPVVLAGATGGGPPPAPPATATLAGPAAVPLADRRRDFDKTNRARPASLAGTARTMPAVPTGPAASGTPPAGPGTGTQACAVSNHAAHARSDFDETNPPRPVGAQKKSVADTPKNMPGPVADPARHLEHEMEHRTHRAGSAAANSDKTKPTTRSSTTSTNSKTSTPASRVQEERAALAVRALLIRASSA